ncbi:MAG: DUF2577 domain-containing protein [Lachnospiraceae bacterium]
MSEENEKTSLKQLFQEIAGKGNTEVLQGIVKSVNPLKIQIINDEKLTIGSNITYVPKHLTDYTTTYTISKGSNKINEPVSDDSGLTDFALSGNITIHNALQAGEKVHVFSFNHGKQYYVLDRVVG